jgi:hypothetical protein
MAAAVESISGTEEKSGTEHNQRDQVAHGNAKSYIRKYQRRDCKSGQKDNSE